MGCAPQRLAQAATYVSFTFETSKGNITSIDLQEVRMDADGELVVETLSFKLRLRGVAYAAYCHPIW
jgi:hypothetical protein